MTQYRCTHCDLPFEHNQGRLRCPSCLRQHGLEAVGTAQPATPTKGVRLTKQRILGGMVVLFGLALASAGGALLVRLRTEVPPPGALALLDPGLLERTLRQRGVPREQLVNPFAVSDPIRSLAAKGQGSDPRSRATSLARQLATRLKGRVRVDLTGHSDAPIRDAAGLLAAITDKKADRVDATSFELAALLVACLRAADLAAFVAQSHELEAPVRTADVAGGVGRYLVVVYPSEEKLGGKPAKVLDPARATELPGWAGGGADPSMQAKTSGKLLPLDDATAAAHMLALRALRLRRRSLDEAYRLSDLALKAAAGTETLLLVRAHVLVSAGGVKDAADAAHRALALRDAPAQHLVLALAQMIDGSIEKAISHLEQAIRQDPHYWPAHRALAVLTAGEPSRSDKHLEAGLKVAPEEPSLLLLQASRLLGQGQNERAIALLREIDRRAPSEAALLLLYQALLGSGQDQDAAALRPRLLAMAAEPKKMTQVLDAIDQARAGAPERSAPAPSPPPAAAPPRADPNPP